MKYFISLSALATAALATPVPEPEAAPVAPRDGVKPWTIALQSRKVGRSVQSGPRRVDIPTTTWLRNGKDLQWYALMTIGTPPQLLTVLFDTAYTEILIPSSNCTTSCGTHNRFNASQSSTFSPLPGDTYEAAFGTSGTTIPLDPDVVTGATVHVITDKVCLGGLCVQQQEFVAADNYSKELNEQPMDGLFGLSIVKPEDDYWWSNIVNSGQVPSPEFSWYMEPGRTSGSQLTLGGRDPSKFKGPVTELDLNVEISDTYHSWILDIPAVYIDGKRVTNKTAPGRPPIPYGVGLLDLATAGVVLPNNNTARDLYAQISPLIYQIDPLGAWGAPCAVIDWIAKDVTLTFGETGKTQMNLTVPREAFNAGPYPGQPGICQAIFNNAVPDAFDRVTHRPGWVIGGALFRYYYTIWNGKDLKFSIAKPIWKL